MITGETLSTGLIRDLLAFESEKYNIPIHVSVMDLNDYAETLSIRKAIEVYINSGTGLTKEITLNDTTITLSNVHLPYEANVSDDGIYGTSHNKVFIGFDMEFYKEKPFINALFSSIFDKIMPGIKQYMDNEADAEWKDVYLKMKKKLRKEKVQAMKSDIDANAEEIDNKTNEIKELTNKNFTLAQAIQSISNEPEGIMNRTARVEFESLLRLTPSPIDSMELDASEGKITVSTNDISIEHDDNDYYIGKFRIDIYPIKSEIRFTNLIKKVKGYHHPHISQDGTPCFGNIASTVYYLLIHQDLFQLVTLLIEFLKSYNEDNPYKSIDYWDENYDEDKDREDRYEGCYEDVGPYECVACSDTDCPYHDDAQDRCHEMRESEDECLECTRGCQYARRYDECLDNQDANHSECRTCEITECPHNLRQPERA